MSPLLNIYKVRKPRPRKQRSADPRPMLQIPVAQPPEQAPAASGHDKKSVDERGVAIVNYYL